MDREQLGDLVAFLAVIEEASFTRAAARLGTSQSSVSHNVRRLEKRLGVRLLTRTTRSVSPTEAGIRLAETVGPAFAKIAAEFDGLDAFRQRPAGSIRITSSKYAAETIVVPAVLRLMAEHPEINVEVSVDQRFVDLAAERFDAGVRLGEQVEKDMIAMRIGPDLCMVAAASPDYLARQGVPETPHDLTGHNCINLRLPTFGGLYAWEFERDGRALQVRVDGQFTSNDTELIIKAAIEGAGVVCLPDDHLSEHVNAGRLVPILTGWCPPFPGYHLYYPSRHQKSVAFALLLDALRYRPG
ncbi:LysR family transcriptional regulator [Acuticoccus sediminis]|uniref:LysR family transcriptional regulator n=1 Tax=Acuticoccus sediminis TaxID=2184697 RepID=UPI001CFD4155|nr:LysR family transcriptional regulator [Acuticoccus sediminis]